MSDFRYQFFVVKLNKWVSAYRQNIVFFFKHVGTFLIDNRIVIARSALTSTYGFNFYFTTVICGYFY